MNDQQLLSLHSWNCFCLWLQTWLDLRNQISDWQLGKFLFSCIHKLLEDNVAHSCLFVKCVCSMGFEVCWWLLKLSKCNIALTCFCQFHDRWFTYITTWSNYFWPTGQFSKLWQLASYFQQNWCMKQEIHKCKLKKRREVSTLLKFQHNSKSAIH